ncbi:MAG: zinc ribbon domain-containing protein [archaeon]
MRSKLACLTLALVLFASVTPRVFAATPLFDGMYVVWTGSGEWDYNGLKSPIKISARLQSMKTSTTYVLSISGSISGVPRTAPLLTQTVTFRTSGTDRTITYNNTQYYSPFWIDAGKNVGDKVQVGPVSSPYVFDLQTYESRNVLGKSIRCLVASYSIRLSNPVSITTISGTALFDVYSGIFMAGTMNYLFSSLQSPYYEKIVAEATLSETNVEIGGPSLPWWILPVVAGIIASIAVGVILVWQKRKRRASPRSQFSSTKSVPTPLPTPPSLMESPPPPVTEELPKPSQPAPSLVLGMTCRLCGAAIRDGWTFCGDCGTPYQDRSKP